MKREYVYYLVIGLALLILPFGFYLSYKSLFGGGKKSASVPALSQQIESGSEAAKVEAAAQLAASRPAEMDVTTWKTTAAPPLRRNSRARSRCRSFPA